MDEIIIFGAGKYYEERKHRLPANVKIVAFIDNNSMLWGQYLDGACISDPKKVMNIPCNKILLMSTKAVEMKKQLLDMGVSEDNIWPWERYDFEFFQVSLKRYCNQNTSGKYNKRILVISTSLSYNGGSIAAIYAVKALQAKGNQVLLVAPEGNRQFANEMAKEGINIILCSGIQYLKEEGHWCWVRQFDVVVVNVFQMLPCACMICNSRPVLWWIHENSDCFDGIYKRTLEEFPQYDNISNVERINVAAVSEIAKKGFETHYPNRVDHILPFGIPDKYVPHRVEEDKKFIYAIIGYIYETKAQKIFVQAVNKLSQEEREQAEFWLIGSDNSSEYCKAVKKMAMEIPQVKLLGQLTRQEMDEIYQKIDVVVCASLEETMSITIVEGMMHKKICITTDMTGIADYISDGINGFICKAGDVDSLQKSMAWIINHKNEMSTVKENARRTYEEYFTMERFGERLEDLIEKTEEKWEKGSVR